MEIRQCDHIGLHHSLPPLKNGCKDGWGWDVNEKSDKVRLYGQKIAYFHPLYSYGTAAVRGNRALNDGRYYWEVYLGDRVFGTSMSVGIGTKKARLWSPTFVNMIGEDEHSWGLNHKGVLWHGGECRLWSYTYKPCTIGLYFDGISGTLSYYVDGFCLGVAFTGLQEVKESLYPMVCSTAARTTMCLSFMKREFTSLQDRCRQSIVQHLPHKEHVQDLEIPTILKSYLHEGFDHP